MKRSGCVLLAAWLAGSAPGSGQAPPPPGYPELAILQLKVIEGEGAVHAAGSRSASALTVQVTDETGRPVEGVTVSFRMPVSGPTGVFQNGLPTEVFVTGPDGKVAVTGIRWGSAPGPVRIRITAVRGQVRAGIVSEQYVAEPAQLSRSATGAKPARIAHNRGRWVALAVAAAGAAAGGLVLGMAGKSQTAASAGAIAASQTQGVQVGAPTIRVGKP
jgi:hypothetical protein